MSEPLPEGTKCLEPKEYRVPKPTETQVLSMVRLMTTATTWDEFRAIPRDEKLKTIKQLQARSCSMDTLLVHGEWLSQVQDLSAKMV